MKIRIIGVSGSGKTRLAEGFSEEFHVPHYDLDDLMWDNASGTYGKKREPEKRDEILGRIMEKDGWIIEGVYYKWCMQTFEEADRIYLLDVPRRKCRFRIIRRFIRRKLGLEKGKKETVKSLRALLKWSDKYREAALPEIKKILEQYQNKVIIID